MELKRAIAFGVGAVNSLDSWVHRLKAEMSAAKSAFAAGAPPDKVREHVNAVNDILFRPENEALDRAMDAYQDAI